MAYIWEYPPPPRCYRLHPPLADSYNLQQSNESFLYCWWTLWGKGEGRKDTRCFWVSPFNFEISPINSSSFIQSLLLCSTAVITEGIKKKKTWSQEKHDESYVWATTWKKKDAIQLLSGTYLQIFVVRNDAVQYTWFSSIQFLRLPCVFYPFFLSELLVLATNSAQSTHLYRNPEPVRNKPLKLPRLEVSFVLSSLRRKAQVVHIRQLTTPKRRIGRASRFAQHSLK